METKYIILIIVVITLIILMLYLEKKHIDPPKKEFYKLNLIDDTYGIAKRKDIRLFFIVLILMITLIFIIEK
jgi:hypothetical protein